MSRRVACFVLHADEAQVGQDANGVALAVLRETIGHDVRGFFSGLALDGYSAETRVMCRIDGVSIHSRGLSVEEWQSVEHPRLAIHPGQRVTVAVVGPFVRVVVFVEKVEVPSAVRSMQSQPAAAVERPEK